MTWERKTKQHRKWQAIKKAKMMKVPFRKRYCRCGKLSFTKAEAERYRLVQLDQRGSKRKAHVYECPESYDYHLTYNTGLFP